MPLYPPSNLDSNQVLQHAFDDATQRLRVETDATVIAGAMEVAIDHTTDSIKIGDGIDLLSINSDGTIDIKNITGTISLPTGAATSALQTAGNLSLASIDTKLTAPLSVAQSGTWNINNISGTISLPTGAATESTLTTIKTFLQNDYISGMIEAPQNKTYTLDPASIETRVLNSLKIYTTSGTCTVDIKINGVSVTGLSSLAVSSTPQEAVATALNNVAPGDVITLVVSSSSGAIDMVFRLKYTRS